jgi:hypothetical protein
MPLPVGPRSVLPLVALYLLTVTVSTLLEFSISNINADYYFCSMIAETLIRGKLPCDHALQISASLPLSYCHRVLELVEIVPLTEEPPGLADYTLNRLVSKLRIHWQTEDLWGGALGHAQPRWTGGEAATIGRLTMDRGRIVDPGANTRDTQPVAQ